MVARIQDTHLRIQDSNPGHPTLFDKDTRIQDTHRALRAREFSPALSMPIANQGA